ncbi:MAG: hypothetical protein KDB47_03370 [Mycobacterium sp.]|nr:hypothetical protein [Mycobacterium sp.]
MSGGISLQRLTGGSRVSLIAGIVLLLVGVGGGSWLLAAVGLALLIGAGVTWYSAHQSADALEQPWAFPPDYRTRAEALARPLDPTPQRLLPPDEKSAMIARVETTGEGLSRLIAEKPPAWPWAVFTSVLVQRRNAVQARLRHVVSGYQPHPGLPALSGAAYSQLGHHVLRTIIDTVEQLEGFMLSPAFTGTLGTDEDTADADATAGLAHRLMDYHQIFLNEAETCLQTPVQPEARVFVQDLGALALAPLVGFDQFILTMCSRIGEAQDLLPYTSTGDVIGLDEVNLTMAAPDGLLDRFEAHVERFNE